MTAVECTLETPRAGVVICQPKTGFRYGSESFWLVGFALEQGVPATALDLGTGSGVMAMLLAAQGVTAWGVDRARAWMPFWEQTLSRTAKPATLVQGDVTGALPQASLVLANPPFFGRGSGTLPADPLLAVARFETTATVGDFVLAAERACEVGGRVCFVVPQSRESEVIEVGEGVGLWPSRVARVGTSRSLVALSRGQAAYAVSHVGPRGPDVRRWVELATAVDLGGVVR